MPMTESQVETFTALVGAFLSLERIGQREMVCLFFDGSNNDGISTVDEPTTLSALRACARSYETPRHPDDLRVLAFADAMIQKLNAKRSEGRDGWQDPEAVSVNKLYSEYTCKVESNPEDFLDVAILAMMLHFRTQEA